MPTLFICLIAYDCVDTFSWIIDLQRVEVQINFASAPRAGADFFIVVLATTNINPLQTLTIGRRSGSHLMDLHGRSMAVRDRSGTNHPIAFNLA